MDTNDEGMVSKREGHRYHSGLWGKMKAKSGTMSMVDMGVQIKRGLN